MYGSVGVTEKYSASLVWSRLLLPFCVQLQDVEDRHIRRLPLSDCRPSYQSCSTLPLPLSLFVPTVLNCLKLHVPQPFKEISPIQSLITQAIPITPFGPYSVHLQWVDNNALQDSLVYNSLTPTTPRRMTLGPGRQSCSSKLLDSLPEHQH